MITLKGAEVSAKIKEQVSEICGCMEGHIPTAALVRVGERPDDISYERGAIKKIHSFGMEVRSYVFPEDIPEEDFMREFERINEDDEIDGILLFKPFPQHLNIFPQILDLFVPDGAEIADVTYGKGVFWGAGWLCPLYRRGSYRNA